MVQNDFEYDEKKEMLIGCYDEYIDIKKVHALILKILRYRRADNIRSLGSHTLQAMAMTKKDDVTIEDGVNMFEKVIGCFKGLAYTNMDHYEARAEPWIKEIVAIPKGDKKRLIFVERYFNVVKQYVCLNVYYDNNITDETCDNCGSIIDENADFCDDCGVQLIKYLNNSNFIDSSPNVDISSSAKSSRKQKDPYDKFHTRYLRYQGRSSTIIPQGDIDTIQSYISKNYRISNITEGTRIQNGNILRITLQKLNMTRHADDINFIMYVMWNYELDNLSSLDERIEKSWREGQEIMEAHKNKKDVQSIAYNDWRLWRELTDAGCDYDVDLFNISPNKDILRQQENLWKKRCKALNKEYVPCPLLKKSSN